MNFNAILYRISHWETWDWRLKYIPLIPVWIWYCLRSRSIWFFTPSNPGLVFGGFDGVSKREMYKLFPLNTYPKSSYVSTRISFAELEKLVASNNFNFPFIAKPEIGRMGFMFRKINTPENLKRYHETIHVDYILQEYIEYPLEVSVFYYRFPNESKGTITGFIKKESMVVSGDGKSTLTELINTYPRARYRMEEIKSKHTQNLNDVIPAGELFYLSHALNLSRGGKLVNLEHEKDENLLKVFDELSHYTKNLYFGRYDIKCASIEDLKRGKNFCILEFNGCGGEPHHVYGNDNTLLKACSILAHHWSILYKISKYNHSKGIHYWKFKKGLRFFVEANKHVTMLKKLDAKFPD